MREREREREGLFHKSDVAEAKFHLTIDKYITRKMMSVGPFAFGRTSANYIYRVQLTG